MDRKRKYMVGLLSGAAVCMTGTGVLHAALIGTLTSDHAPAGGSGSYTPPAAFIPSSTDLLEGKLATLTYVNGSDGSASTGDNGTAESSGGIGVWTDGSDTTTYATGDNATDHAAYGTVDGYNGADDTKTYVTYDLGGLYDLTAADIFTGWNDSGRDLFSFTLQTSVDGTSYTDIGSFTKGPDDTGVYTTPVTNLIDFSDGGAAIASGVEFVRLYVTDADNGYAGLSEVDVTGTPSAAVPEPTCIGLIGLGGLALLRRRR